MVKVFISSMTPFVLVSVWLSYLGAVDGAWANAASVRTQNATDVFRVSDMAPPRWELRIRPVASDYYFIKMAEWYTFVGGEARGFVSGAEGSCHYLRLRRL